MKNVPELIKSEDIKMLDKDTIYLNEDKISKKEFIAYLKLLLAEEEESTMYGRKRNKRRKC